MGQLHAYSFQKWLKLERDYKIGREQKKYDWIMFLYVDVYILCLTTTRLRVNKKNPCWEPVPIHHLSAWEVGLQVEFHPIWVITQTLFQSVIWIGKALVWNKLLLRGMMAKKKRKNPHAKNPLGQLCRIWQKTVIGVNQGQILKTRQMWVTIHSFT